MASFADRYLRDLEYARMDDRRDQVEARKQRKRDRAAKKQVKRHQRRAAGKVVDVRGYCRRGVRSQEQVNREMPF